MHTVKKRRHVVLHLANGPESFHPVYVALLHAAADTGDKALKRELLDAAKYVSPTIMSNADGHILNVYPYLPQMGRLQRFLLRTELKVRYLQEWAQRKLLKARSGQHLQSRVGMWANINRILLIEQRLKDTEP